jgi:ketosteroid isomerase-like protein
MPDTVVTRYFEAFRRRDAAAMAACYADDAHFSDPIFPDLDAAGVRAMWAMLLSRGSDVTVDYTIQSGTPDAADIDWVARYTFSGTGRKVENRVHTRLEIAADRIVRQKDTFDTWRWSRQALGFTGLLLGWSPTLIGKVQAKAARGLESFRARTPC